MIGTPVRLWTNAVPSKSSSTTGPCWRVPSGNITSGSPAWSTSMQVVSAARSAVPRATGMPPRAVKTLAQKPSPFQSESLAR